MDGTLNTPVGKVPKKEAVIGAAVVAVLAVVYYVRKKNAATTSGVATTSTDQFPPDGTTGNPSDPYSTDPATGQTYGNESVGSGGTFGAFSTGAGTDSGTGTTTTSFTTQGGPPFSNNASWTDWSIQELQAQDPSINAGALTDALGAYLQGQPLTANQKTLVDDARAIAGDPPVAGPNGYPPKLRTQGQGGVTNEIVPRVVGDSVADAISAIESAHLKAHSDAKSGTVSAQSPAAGRRVAEGSTVNLTVRSERIRVPHVVNLTDQRAVVEIKRVGLEPEPAAPKPIQPGRAWIVIAQRPAADTEVAHGSVVHLTLRETR